MDTQTLAMICAGFAMIATVIYIVLGFTGVKALQDIRERFSRR
jgi:uncharacterized membrane protein YuzA (DUF378 family)